MFERSSRPSSARPRPSRVYSESTQFRVKHIAGNNNPAPPVLSYFCFSFIKSFYLLVTAVTVSKKKKEKTSKPRFFLYLCQNIFAVCCCFDFQLRLLKFPPYDYRRGATSKKNQILWRDQVRKSSSYFTIYSTTTFFMNGSKRLVSKQVRNKCIPIVQEGGH